MSDEKEKKMNKIAGATGTGIALGIILGTICPPAGAIAMVGVSIAGAVAAAAVESEEDKDDP
ncbi:MAG: hypothetical protein QXG39_09380 [Candidatus Aenigmatarchaeota archaeon]